MPALASLALDRRRQVNLRALQPRARPRGVIRERLNGGA